MKLNTRLLRNLFPWNPINFTQRSTLFSRQILYDLEGFDLFEVHSNRTPKTVGIFRFHSHLVPREDEANRLIMHSALSSGGKERRFPRASHQGKLTLLQCTEVKSSVLKETTVDERVSMLTALRIRKNEDRRGIKWGEERILDRSHDDNPVQSRKFFEIDKFNEIPARFISMLFFVSWFNKICWINFDEQEWK